MAKKGMKHPDETPKKKSKKHSVPEFKGRMKAEKPISDSYPALDTDLARDNLEIDITEADLQDL